MRASLPWRRTFDLDVASQHDTVCRRNWRLVAFDMDSTLIETEVIDELPRHAGLSEQVAAMQGELDFQGVSAGESRCAKDGQPRRVTSDRLGAAYGRGRAPDLDTASAWVQDGDPLGRLHVRRSDLQRRLGIDYLHSNDLDIVDGVVTGEVRTEIVDGARKAHYLPEIARAEGLSVDQVIAVGDGANDLPMLRLAGRGIAFRAKRSSARARVRPCQRWDSTPFSICSESAIAKPLTNLIEG